LQAEQPEMYAKYTIKSSHRRFTIKAAKVDERSNAQYQLLQLLREAG